MIRRDELTVELTRNHLVVSCDGGRFELGLPSIEIDGRPINGATGGDWIEVPASAALDGRTCRSWQKPLEDGLFLIAHVQTFRGSPFARFQFEWQADRPRRLTKAAGHDNLVFTSFAVGSRRLTEVRLGDFNRLIHSYSLHEQPIAPEDARAGLAFMGPILTAQGERDGYLLAYEHGSPTEQRFVEFATSAGGPVALRAVRGSYLAGQVVDAGVGYQTIWLQVGIVPGTPIDLAAAYRDFVLNHQSEFPATRRPNVYYNTWNYQERLQAWQGKKYLAEMNQARMEAEIDKAAAMGIEVFVIDTGWFEKTGDWRVNASRFGDQLRPIKARLTRHGMRLGLWFDNAAAVSSRMLAEHAECVMRHGPQDPKPGEIWETEASFRMCPVSRWWTAFADELIRLHREVGVDYYKLDAVQQVNVWSSGEHHFCCDAAGHDHGGANNDPRERAERFGFLLPIYMGRIAERVARAVPDAIVDFDMTEGGRCFGLSFLNYGKFFLINNGPYYGSYRIPQPPDRNTNIFFYPAPSRNWICRSSYSLDKWIPSTLLLTHYMPDAPAHSQIDSIASLMLGHNGIWGDLVSLGDDDISRFAYWLGHYKRVREDMASATPVVTGRTGSPIEIHEKINSRTGRGGLAFFAPSVGSIDYVTRAVPVGKLVTTPGLDHERLSDGRIRFRGSFSQTLNAHIAIVGD